MNDNIYFIENAGYDGETYGLARISEEDFPKFKLFIENLNKNACYSCPVISVYEVRMDNLKEINYNPNLDCFDKNYIDKGEIFYLDDKTYTFTEGYYPYYSKLKCIIGNK